MSKLVVLNIDEGSFEQGFPVRLEIGEDGKIHHKIKVTLTPAPDIPRFYEDWQTKYRNLGKTRQINIPESQVTHLCVIDDEKFARERFETSLKQWFTQLSWEKLQVRIEEKTHPKETIRVIIDTHNIYLKKLPWHLWQLFNNRPQAEFALSAEYAPPSESLKRPVKILAIFGGSEGLDLTSDKDLMTKLRRRGATVTWLEQPQRDELSRSLWEQHWDILFFAGHSSSGEEFHSGEIQINDTETISLTRLRNALRIAVQNGLKLAIFNSCDGLGLANELIGVKVPQMIVMREPVPDEVARKFLQYFLEKFSQGHSFYLAVRNARQRLEWMEDKFPCASWLPVICQNPAARPFVWAKKSIFDNKIAFLAGITFSIVAAIAFFFPRVIQERDNSQPKQTLTHSQSISSPINGTETNLKDLGENFSWGEKILITSNSNQWKRDGQKAFNEGNYPTSIVNFEESLKQNKNDPETLIYLNNAVAMKPSKMHKLPVPITANGKVCNINEPNPLKIAVIAPSIANLNNEINQEILRGVAQAQNKTNLQCGIEGRMLQIIIVDDNNNPTKSSQVATKLVNEKDILAVVGHYSSGATESAGKVYKNKMVVISPGSTAVRNSENKGYGLNLNKYVFRTPTNDEIASQNLVNYMVNKLGNKKAAIAYNSSKPYSDNFRKELENQLKSRNGELIIFSECALDNNLNLEKCVKNAKEEVSILMLVPATSQNWNKVLNMLNTYNDFDLTLLGGDSLYRKTVEQKGEKVRNLVVAVPWFNSQSNQSEFERDALELWNTQVSWHTAMSYDATIAIVEGLRRIIRNGKNPTAQELQKVLSAEDFFAQGAAGKIEFDRDGDRKITPENNDQIGVLVQVKCETTNDCKFDRVPQQ
ncbi:MAG: ABC transporter substrate-binding protein [Cyanobacteria bacterium P01_D01_bin.50]